MQLPLSVLDLVPIGTGSSAVHALRDSLELARLAETSGYTRYWFAEHHGMPSIASSSPEILIAHIAAATQRMRIGSGGVMLQNHVPLQLAEQFHTLEALYPGRIDLGIGRAPGTDPATSRALRPFSPAQFADQLGELIGLSSGTLPADHAFSRVRVIPSGVDLPPIWLLGSSGASAEFAGSRGLGYAFASHFSAAPAEPAARAYRAAFSPSAQFAEPHMMLAVAAICAETDEEADYLASTGDLVWVRLQRGEFGPPPSPEEALAYPYTEQERSVARSYRALQFIGTPGSLRERIGKAAADAGADEVMVSTMIHDPAARRRSYQLLAEAFSLNAAAS
ncbi:MAG TPA: LLM class flavin-dependent oxidoreductase [Longimicrobiales bacterium]|nr:LLM class flavin-dependent oxidoreductase [Longimicrobiales bacterium]